MAGIYIHIPFCHSKCAYCDFFSTPVTQKAQAVVDAIVAELAMRRSEIPTDIDTVYIGGGTPSILPVPMLAPLAEAIGMDALQEFTIEANPEDIDARKVREWRALGINRVSMGVQSLVDSELQIIGRRHSAAQALRAMDIIRTEGVDNISLDLIYGLPGQTFQSWQYSLSKLLDLLPEHFSAYMLSYEPRTRLTAMLNAGRIAPVDDDTAAAMYDFLIEYAQQRGYLHYEISNFAKPGFEAKHNSSYWHGIPYLGLGPAAHSFDGKLRRVNPSNINAYIEAIAAGNVAYEVEQLSRADRFNDMIITALRTSDGIDFAKVPISRRRQLLCDAYQYIQGGQIQVIDNHLRIPQRLWLVSDDIMRHLIVD